MVARRLGLPLGFAEAVGGYYRAQLLNSVLPVGVLGDAERAVRHGRRAGDLGRAVRAVVMERTGGQVVLVVVAGVALAFTPSAVVSGAGGLAAGLGALVVILTVGCVGAGLAARRWPRARAALVAARADLRRGLALDTWPAVVLLSTAALAGHLTLFVVAARSAGASGPLADLLPLLVLALLAMGLPLNVGGFGPREALGAVAFGAAGLGASLGLTVAVTYGLLALVACLPGVVPLVGWRARRRGECRDRTDDRGGRAAEGGRSQRRLAAVA